MSPRERLFRTICPAGDTLMLVSSVIDLIDGAIAADPSLLAAFEPEPATPPAYVERVITDPQPWGGRQTGRQSGHDVARAIGQPPY